MFRKRILVAAAFAITAGTTWAQFTGPSVQGGQSTVSDALNARLGSYVTLQGNLVSHLREDHYMFRDKTGEIRVEISPGRFGGKQVGPEDSIRIMGEVDKNLRGRYIWVKSLSLAN